MRYLTALTVLCLFLAADTAVSWGDDWVECGFPDTTNNRDFVEIDLDDLFEDEQYAHLRGANTDINLWVEDLIVSHPLLDDDHLREFIDEIWFPNGDDIREVWNYFASGPTRPVYGDPSYEPDNFEYPSGATDVNIKLRDHSFSTGGGNTVWINITCAAGYISDDWSIGSRAPWTFCHEFQHTIRSYFDSEFGFFEEAFAEAATRVAGRPRINVGVPHSDNTWHRYDLAFNIGILRRWSLDHDQDYKCQSTQAYSQHNAGRCLRCVGSKDRVQVVVDLLEQRSIYFARFGVKLPPSKGVLEKNIARRVLGLQIG